MPSWAAPKRMAKAAMLPSFTARVLGVSAACRRMTPTSAVRAPAGILRAIWASWSPTGCVEPRRLRKPAMAPTRPPRTPQSSMDAMSPIPAEPEDDSVVDTGFVPEPAAVVAGAVVGSGVRLTAGVEGGAELGAVDRGVAAG